jgi:hypothetical protein
MRQVSSEEEESGNPIQVGATMGAPAAAATAAAADPVRIGFGTVSDPEVAYPHQMNMIDPHTILYSQNSRPYGQQVRNDRSTILQEAMVRNNLLFGVVFHLPRCGYTSCS